MENRIRKEIWSTEGLGVYWRKISIGKKEGGMYGVHIPLIPPGWNINS